MEKIQNNRAKWLILGIMLLIFAAVKIALLFWWQAQQTPSQHTDCQPHQHACPFAQGATLQLLGVDKHNTPFRIRVHNAPAQTQNISVSFSMRDMDMGFNRFDLQKQSDGTWQLDNVRLPLCTAARHDWQIQWKMDEQHFQAAFQTQP